MLGIRMFRPKACSPDGYSPGTTDDLPDDIELQILATPSYSKIRA